MLLLNVVSSFASAECIGMKRWSFHWKREAVRSFQSKAVVKLSRDS